MSGIYYWVIREGREKGKGRYLTSEGHPDAWSYLREAFATFDHPQRAKIHIHQSCLGPARVVRVRRSFAAVQSDLLGAALQWRDAMENGHPSLIEDASGPLSDAVDLCKQYIVYVRLRGGGA